MTEKRKFRLYFKGKALEVEAGVKLRKALLDNELSPHNGAAKWLNCKGLGTCGTCALEVEGLIDPQNTREKWRLNFPPHQQSSKLRLACQITVHDNLRLKKHPGFWGEKVGVSHN
jgi:ferredoxin